MSADNGRIIQQNSAGKYVLQTYFASADDFPDPEMARSSELFDTLEGAVRKHIAEEQSGNYTEYGLTFKIENDLAPMPEDVRNHAMFSRNKAHDDGRRCMYHVRLGKWTPDGLFECLRTHEGWYP